MVDEHGLGRVASPVDERDKMYPFARALPPLEEPRPEWRYWHRPTNMLDQGATPHCVGFSGAHLIASSPVRSEVGEEEAHAYYWNCKEIDGIPNTDGTYVRALAKVFQERDIISMYLWAQTIQELGDWVLTQGPVIMGSLWTHDMFRPNSKGVIQPTGGIAGGHAYVIRGYNPKTGLFRGSNSWGKSWGQNGDFWIAAADLEFLLHEGGEAMTAIEMRQHGFDG